MSLRTAAVTLLAVGFGAPPVPAQGGNVATQRLVGYVLASTGDPTLPDHITVRLELEGTGLQRQALVNASGYFQFDGLPPGRFKLTVESPGRRTVVEHVDVRAAMVAPRGEGGSGEETRTYVNLGGVVDPEATADPVQAGKTVSAELLAVPREALQEMDKAAQAADNDDPERAIRHLERALEIHPEFSQAYINLAAQHLQLGERLRAIDALKESIRLRFDNPLAHRNLGLIHLQAREFPEALAALKTAAEQDSRDPQNVLLVGRAYYESGDAARALEWLEKAVEADETDPVAQLTLGYCYLKLKRYSETLECFDRFLQLEPDGGRAEQVRELAGRIRAVAAGNGSGKEA